jgi:hypothetical protein
VRFEVLVGELFLTFPTSYIFLLNQLQKVPRSSNKDRLLSETIGTLVFVGQPACQTRLTHHFLTSKTLNRQVKQPITEFTVFKLNQLGVLAFRPSHWTNFVLGAWIYF